VGGFALVQKSQLATGNALETLSYTLSGVFGPYSLDS
jgi:hypothetical protein